MRAICTYSASRACASLTCSMRRSATPIRSFHRSVRVKRLSSASSASGSAGSSERTCWYPLAAPLVDYLQDRCRLPPQVAGEHPLQRQARPLVPRIEEQDLPVVLERPVRLLQVLLQRLPEPELQVDDLGLADIELDPPPEGVD